MFMGTTGENQGADGLVMFHSQFQQISTPNIQEFTISVQLEKYRLEEVKRKYLWVEYKRAVSIKAEFHSVDRSQT